MTTPVGGASVFGGLGKLEIAPANGPEDPFPYYIDITPYVRTEQTDLQIARGRDSNLNAFQPGQLTCVLDNSTGIFTPGYDPRVNVVTDTFNRTVSNGWGTADTGQTWFIDTGIASEFSVAPGFGVIVPTVQFAPRLIAISTGLNNCEVLMDMQVNSFSGGQINLGAVVRGDGTNYYLAVATYDPSGTVTLNLWSLIAGGTTTLASMVTSLTNPAGTRFRLRANVFGQVLRAKIWVAGTTEPDGWMVSTTDMANYLTSNRFGVYVRDDSTGAGTTFHFPAFSASSTGVWGGVGGFTTARKVRYSETVGSRTFQEFTGWVEYPDVQDWQPIGYQEVQLTATDRLARLTRGRPFVSTLGAHIVGSARNGALKGYWPLNDAGAPVQAAVGVGVSSASTLLASSLLSSTQAPTFGYGKGLTIPGDDVATLQMTVGLNGTTVAWTPEVVFTLPTVTIAAGQLATMVLWLNQIDLNGVNPAALIVNTNLVASNVQLETISDGLGVHWRAVYFDGSLNNVDSANGSANATSRWYILALQWGFNPNTINLWVDGSQYTGTFTNTPTTASTTGGAVAVSGSVGHVQFYVGAPTDFTFADFQAQQQVGLLGLEGQTTGQRVNAILNYAGVSANDRVVDPGVSYMAKVTLAGRSPGDVLAEAVTTEQGRGFALGTGPYAFHDRQRVMNV